GLGVHDGTEVPGHHHVQHPGRPARGLRVPVDARRGRGRARAGVARLTARRPHGDRDGIVVVGVVIAAVVSIGVVGCAVFVVFAQPRPVWRDAAEHSRWFWLAWVTVSVVVGLVPAVSGVFAAWGAIVWLTFCCAL